MLYICTASDAMNHPGGDMRCMEGWSFPVTKECLCVSACVRASQLRPSDALRVVTKMKVTTHLAHGNGMALREVVSLPFLLHAGGRVHSGACDLPRLDLTFKGKRMFRGDPVAPPSALPENSMAGPPCAAGVSSVSL